MEIGKCWENLEKHTKYFQGEKGQLLELDVTEVTTNNFIEFQFWSYKPLLPSLTDWAYLSKITVCSQRKIFWASFQIQGLHSELWIHYCCYSKQEKIQRNYFVLRNKDLLSVHHSDSTNQTQHMISWRQHIATADIKFMKNSLREWHFRLLCVLLTHVIHFHHTLLFKFSSKLPTDYHTTMQRDEVFTAAYTSPHGMYPPVPHHKSSDTGSSGQDGILGQECAEPEISCRDLLF